MKSPVENLVQVLHAKRSGEGWIAKCPAHDDRKPSLSIDEGADGRCLLHCHAGCTTANVVAALGLTPRDLFPVTSVRQSANGENHKPASTPTFDWQSCVDAFTDRHAVRLAKWRGYSTEFVGWLRDNELVGLCDGCIAFPLHNSNSSGNVVGAHCRRKDGGWHYTPKGTKTQPFVVGDLVPRERVCVFESQFDMFAYSDISGERNGLVCTRGASNSALAAGLIPEGSTVYLWPQNDAPGAKWAETFAANSKCVVKIVRTPAPHGDLNDWTKAGATSDDLLKATVDAETALKTLKSSKSLGANVEDEAGIEVVDDFPESLSSAAFHGLAGDIARRIEPHSEADPVALYAQTLTAFGNAIGRSAFALADGSRHGPNLCVILVGESSKARKGTAWQHVLRVFERADEDWKQDCMASGLSSGEGMIWAVRDPITRTVKNRKTGEYEEEISDAGVSDKRLCVVEGEFANVLKVMEREGNTLSPVIRSAWDSGNLRSMTKNSEARSTGAHISIIGHITKGELRCRLTETESANGFGNRFLWLAVRRSKCLPEGGNIGSENLNDLVTRLHSAIEFGRKAGEVTRSESARELWRIVYPDLSEGRPGLFGAITARAEAQVLRLSAIFALLDCSTTIEVEHHRAALALWDYCDRSAKWIFSTATGDPHVDRILLALRVAGSNGMTRKQIYDDVFQKNVSGRVQTAALQSLRRSGLACCRKETTGGKPREIWFAKTEDSE